MKEAMLYDRLPERRVHCRLCAWQCVIADGDAGFCQVRQNRGGILYTRAYGRTIAMHPDPIEKKPLHHFYPGSRTLSIATPGCNFRCRWCQNFEISQTPTERHFRRSIEAAPEDIVAAAADQNCRSIAYTYTEPTIFFEYSYDTATLARQHNLANIYVTNGYMSQEMLARLYPCLDAAAVDLKAFRDDTYRKYTGARLQPVLDSLRRLKEHGVWIEIITLVVPEVNDDPGELRDMARFIHNELGAATPWHLSRFMPTYRMNKAAPTPPATLYRSRDIALEEGLQFVYLGNLAETTETRCPGCGKILIERNGYMVTAIETTPSGTCPDCSTLLPGTGMGKVN